MTKKIKPQTISGKEYRRFVELKRERREDLKKERCFYNLCGKLLSFQFLPYTLEECLIASVKIPQIRHNPEWIGKFAYVLYDRVGRSKNQVHTLDNALKHLYGVEE